MDNHFTAAPGKWIRRLLLGIAILILVVTVGFLLWSINPNGPMPSAIQALQSDGQVKITSDRWLIFKPISETATTGLILYPGGRVDPRAYAIAARGIAEKGYLVVIVPMPLNLAVLGSDRAGEVMQDFPDIESWVIGGHSLGGAMAARYALGHSEALRGLVLWASYPSANDDLRQADLRVASIYATQDGLTSLEDIQNSEGLLPLDTLWLEIEGGNHAQFGAYGQQSGDLASDISLEKQQELVIEGTLSLLATIK